MVATKRAFAVFFLGSCIFPSLLAAQAVGDVSSGARVVPEWGTAQQLLLQVPAAAFTPAYAFTTWDSTDGHDRYLTAVVGRVIAAVDLPAGAHVTLVELEACNDSTTLPIAFGIDQCAVPHGACTSFPPSLTVMPPNSSCTFQSATVDLTIDRFQFTQTLWVYLEEGSSQQRLSAVRVYYNLQVSPAPAVPTFNDVPLSHPFFQYIEALSASGITVGCSASPPLYCPNNPLTRGQMAVFLAKALGLQFQY